MSIHLARDGSALGIFTDGEVREGLASGRFRHDDLAWREGMPAWVALASWPEFATVGPSGAVPQAGGLLPWEQGKSLGSFLATLRLAVADPSALASGRYAFGDWIAFAYLAFALVLPFQIAGAILGADRNQEMAAFFSSLNLDDVARGIAEQPSNLGVAIVSLVVGLAFAPLLYALGGLLQWVFQRLFGHKVAVERTVSACLLSAGIVSLVMAPLNLLAFSFVAQMAIGLVALVPGMIIYYRALGGAVGISAWVLFGINLLLWFVTCCCCCAIPVSLLAAAKG